MLLFAFLPHLALLIGTASLCFWRARRTRRPAGADLFDGLGMTVSCFAVVEAVIIVVGPSIGITGRGLAFVVFGVFFASLHAACLVVLVWLHHGLPHPPCDLRLWRWPFRLVAGIVTVVAVAVDVVVWGNRGDWNTGESLALFFATWFVVVLLIPILLLWRWWQIVLWLFYLGLYAISPPVVQRLTLTVHPLALLLVARAVFDRWQSQPAVESAVSERQTEPNWQRR